MDLLNLFTRARISKKYLKWFLFYFIMQINWFVVARGHEGSLEKVAFRLSLKTCCLSQKRSNWKSDWWRWFDLLEKIISKQSWVHVTKKKAARLFFEVLGTQLKANSVVIKIWRVVKRKCVPKRRNESKSIINQNKLSDSSSTPEFRLLRRWRKNWFRWCDGKCLATQKG